MASTGENLRTFILTSTGISALVSTRVYENTVPMSKDLPFIWYQRRTVQNLDILGEAEAVPYLEYYDVECVDDSVDGAIDLADLTRTKLEGHSGTMGTTVYQWVSVRDQRDDYISRMQAADEQLSISALDVEIINQ